MTSKFEEALQTCLDLILGGNETIETAISHFPEWSDELRPQLETALWLTSYRKALEPRPGFVSASRRRVVERIQAERQLAPLTWRERLQQLIPIQRVAPVAFVFIALLALFVGGSFVSEAQKALPGDRLYGMKITLEGLALATTPSQAGDAKIQVRNVQKRLEEIRALIEEGSVDEAAQTAADLDAQVTQARVLFDQVASQDPAMAISLYMELASILERQRGLLSYLNSTPNPNYQAIYYSLSQVLVQADEIDKEVEIIRVAITEPTSTTSAPVFLPSPTETRIFRNTPTPAPTREPDEPTNTPRPTQPPPTHTPVPTQRPTATPEPTNTPFPTNTPVTPTDTPTEVPPTPTDTPVTPTDTPTEVPPTPTDTPEPPTETPVPSDTPTDFVPVATTPPPDLMINTPTPSY